MSKQATVRKDTIGEGASTIVLLALMLFCVTGSVESANWADGLTILTWAALGGLALGILFARLPVRGWVAHPFMLVSGVGVVAFLASTLLPRVLTIQEKLLVLQERFIVWVSKATFGGVSTDNLMFVVQVAFFAWVLAYLSGWFVYRRHQVWGAILPTGVALLFNLFYALPQTPLYFTLYILCTLLLIVRQNLHTMEIWWRKASVGYAGDISFDFLTYGVMFSVLFMIVAWVFPASPPGPSWLSVPEPLQGPWQGLEDQFNRMFSSLRAVARPSPAAFFGTTLALGGPVHLGNEPVMDIQASTGRYFRATLYDKYTGAGWIDTHSATLNLPANDSLLADSLNDLGRVAITQTYKLFIPDQNLLYAESSPILYNLNTELRYSQAPGSDSKTDPLDVSVARARRQLRPGDTYSVISAVSVADEESLRATSTDYPPWISATYLQLPDTLPTRVRELAETITAPYQNPYDKATAIEQYLRSRIQYNDNVSAPPEGRDGVDYTLFDRPEGYCTYYASAMIVMARAVGIPARMAAGYSMGEYADGVYHIVQANGHAWPEVFFPGYGWIEFEPTASKPDIVRPKKPEAPVDAPDAPNPNDVKSPVRKFPNKDLEDPERQGTGQGSPFANSFFSNPRNVGAAGLSLLALAGAGAIGVWQWRRRQQFSKLAPAARFYENLVQFTRLLGVEEQKYATPFERAHIIGEALPEVGTVVQHATALYVREKFAARPLDAEEQKSLNVAWRSVRAAWLHGLVARIVNGIITPPREFAAGILKAMERWGKSG